MKGDGQNRRRAHCCTFPFRTFECGECCQIALCLPLCPWTRTLLFSLEPAVAKYLQLRIICALRRSCELILDRVQRAGGDSLLPVCCFKEALRRFSAVVIEFIFRNSELLDLLFIVLVVTVWVVACAAVM